MGKARTPIGNFMMMARLREIYDSQIPNFGISGLKKVGQSFGFEKSIAIIRLPFSLFQILYDRGCTSLIVHEDDNVIGGLTYRPIRDNTSVEICLCAIREDRQREGHASQLMKALKDDIHIRFPGSIRFIVSSADVGAVAWFEKMGFERAAEDVMAEWNGHIEEIKNGIFVVKKISNDAHT
mmetsp:Transcript_22910/g.38372  ORF Transcript_22910/g.38372 Transcript_22910/m.38372 type:complete len:181 (-) Transcript_22910:71-613(-)